MPKLAGQLAQDAQVDGSVDFSGYGSSCPRCPRCFGGPYGASIQELGVRRLFGRGVGAGGWLQRAIPIRDFKSHRDYVIHAAAQRGESSQSGSCPGAPGHHIIHLSNGAGQRNDR